MNLQHVETLNRIVETRFRERLARDGAGSRLQLSWSNWCFGREPLARSAARLAAAGIEWIELHGNHYGSNLGYDAAETQTILSDHGLRCAGVCGMFSAENDLSSPSGVVRQRALDYLFRTLDFAAAQQAQYVLVVPGAVGRPEPQDEAELARSAETLRRAAPRFGALGIRAAIEPIRADEVSFCHSVADAEAYLAAVNHPAIAHLNGDVYHMQTSESHIGQAILAADGRLTNLHLADSQRGALGTGSLDLDTILRALYAIGYNRSDCFCTPEPLGPGGRPYTRMHGQHDPQALDQLVQQTTRYFREREEAILTTTAVATA